MDVVEALGLGLAEPQGLERDDLQAAIALLRAGELEMPLQFENFRD